MVPQGEVGAARLLTPSPPANKYCPSSMCKAWCRIAPSPSYSKNAPQGCCRARHRRHKVVARRIKPQDCFSCPPTSLGPHAYMLGLARPPVFRRGGSLAPPRWNGDSSPSHRKVVILRIINSKNWVIGHPLQIPPSPVQSGLPQYNLSAVAGGQGQFLTAATPHPRLLVRLTGRLP